MRIVGTDLQSHDSIAGSTFCDSFKTIPRADDPTYVQQLLDICVEQRVEVLIPISDPELQVIADNEQVFRKRSVLPVVSPPSTIRMWNDKLLTAQSLIRHGQPAPLSVMADQADPHSFTYPVFVKPRQGYGSHDSTRIEGPDELLIARRRVPGLVVQDLLEGTEYTIDVLSSLEGRVFAVVPKIRIETRSGLSYKAQTVADVDLIQAALGVASAFPIRGPISLQCMANEKGISFFEVNPRFSASLPLTVAAGINGPEWLLRMAKGESPPTRLLEFKEVTMLRYWEELYRDAGDAPIPSRTPNPFRPNE